MDGSVESYRKKQELSKEKIKYVEPQNELAEELLKTKDLKEKVRIVKTSSN